METDKSRENQLRRVAKRCGLVVLKCRRRNPMALGYGTYAVHDFSNRIIAYRETEGGYGLTLDEVEQILDDYEFKRTGIRIFKNHRTGIRVFKN